MHIILHYLLELDIPVWAPLVAAMLLGLLLIKLGARAERRRADNLAERQHRHALRSIIIHH